MALIDISKITNRGSVVQSARKYTVVKSFDGFDKIKLEDIYADRLSALPDIHSELVNYALGEIKAFNDSHEFVDVLYNLGVSRNVITLYLLSLALPIRSNHNNKVIRQNIDDGTVAYGMEDLVERYSDGSQSPKIQKKIIKGLETDPRFTEYVSSFVNEVCEDIAKKFNQLLDEKLYLRDDENLFVYKCVGNTTSVEVCNVSTLVDSQWHSSMAMQYNFAIVTIIHAIAHTIRKAHSVEEFRSKLIEFANEEVMLSSEDLVFVSELSRNNVESVATLLRSLVNEVEEDEFNLLKEHYVSFIERRKSQFDHGNIYFIEQSVKSDSYSSYIFSSHRYEPKDVEFKCHFDEDGSQASVKFELDDIKDIFYPITMASRIGDFAKFVLAVFAREDGSMRELSVFNTNGDVGIMVNPEYPFMSKHGVFTTMGLDYNSLEKAGDVDGEYKCRTYIHIGHLSYM